jgi:1,4-alpha-glucan branching enzyme
MPISAFPGDLNWGYDGVLAYAPHPSYGAPDDLRALIDASPGLGLMVFSK